MRPANTAEYEGGVNKRPVRDVNKRTVCGTASGIRLRSFTSVNSHQPHPRRHHIRHISSRRRKKKQSQEENAQLKSKQAMKPNTRSPTAQKHPLRPRNSPDKIQRSHCVRATGRTESSEAIASAQKPGQNPAEPLRPRNSPDKIRRSRCVRATGRTESGEAAASTQKPGRNPAEPLRPRKSPDGIRRSRCVRAAPQTPHKPYGNSQPSTTNP